MGKSIFANKKLNDRTSEWKVQYDSKDIIKRALALSYVCLLSETLGSQNEADEKFIMNLINDSGLKEFFTKKETEFVYGKRSGQNIIDFNWHYERLAVLLMALGHKISLKWDGLVSAAELIKITTSKEFASSSKLIKPKKIAQFEQEANEAYWISVDAKINNKPIAAYSKKNINPEIARERLSAVRWIYSSEKTEWDICMPDTYFPYTIEKSPKK